MLRTARRARVREVKLLAGNVPVVLARSVIPHRTLCGRHSPLARLGTRPLGDWLFSHPSMRRLTLEFTHVRPEFWHPDIAASCSIDAPLWGRRSHYRVARHPLLVCEFFLPQLLTMEQHVVLESAG